MNPASQPELRDSDIVASFEILKAFTRQGGNRASWAFYPHGWRYRDKDQSRCNPRAFFRVLSYWRKTKGFRVETTIRLNRHKIIPGFNELHRFLTKKGLTLTVPDMIEMVRANVASGDILKAFVKDSRELGWACEEASTISGFRQRICLLSPQFSNSRYIQFTTYQFNAFLSFCEAIVSTRNDKGNLKRACPVRKFAFGFREAKSIKKINDLYNHIQN